MYSSQNAEFLDREVRAVEQQIFCLMSGGALLAVALTVPWSPGVTILTNNFMSQLSLSAGRVGRLTRNHIGPSTNSSVLNRHWFCHAAIQTPSILNDSQTVCTEF